MTNVPDSLGNILAWSEIARNVGIVVAGIVGLGLAAWRTRAANLQAQAALEQSELARRDHITEIFNRSVGQLADEKLEVRLGAIYSLRAICQDVRYQNYTWPIVETLAAHVRARTDGLSGELTVDLRAILEFLAFMQLAQKTGTEGGNGDQSPES